MQNPDVHPESYGFVLDFYYADIREWVLFGTEPSRLKGNSWILNYAKEIIHKWVGHNEMHHSFLKLNQGLLNESLGTNIKPRIEYVEFWYQNQLMELAIKNVDLLSSAEYHKTLGRLGL